MPSSGNLSSGNVDAPIPATRPPARAARRVHALFVVLLLASALGALWSQSSRYHDDPLGLAKPPFAMDGRAWRSVLTVAATSNAACPASVPVVVMYVNPDCPHCHAELQRLAARIHGNARSARCVGLAIVAAPTKTLLTTWLPPDLVPLLAWDYDGAVAHTLRATLVPTTAYITRKGVVVARVVGESDERSTQRRLDDLQRLSTAAAGAR
jgi:hypothetical protein